MAASVRKGSASGDALTDRAVRGGRAVSRWSYERSGGWSKVSVQKLEPRPTQAFAFGVSDKGSGRPAVSQAPGIDDRFTVTCSCGQPLLGWPRRGRIHPLELGDPGASRLGVVKGCWAQDRTAGRTCSEKVTITHDSDEFARRLWSVLT